MPMCILSASLNSSFKEQAFNVLCIYSSVAFVSSGQVLEDIFLVLGDWMYLSLPILHFSSQFTEKRHSVPWDIYKDPHRTAFHLDLKWSLLFVYSRNLRNTVLSNMDIFLEWWEYGKEVILKLVLVSLDLPTFWNLK